jgi:hypothetical protein
MSEHVFVPGSRKPPPVPHVNNRGRPASSTRKCPVELRECKFHGLTEFAFYSRGHGARRWRCKRCVGEWVTRRKQKIKRILVAEAGGCCAICGYDATVINLHFHHVDPALKSFNLNMSTTKAIGRYREEAKKCVLLCANCHGEVEAGLMKSPLPGAKFGELY